MGANTPNAISRDSAKLTGLKYSQQLHKRACEFEMALVDGLCHPT